MKNIQMDIFGQLKWVKYISPALLFTGIKEVLSVLLKIFVRNIMLEWTRVKEKLPPKDVIVNTIEQKLMLHWFFPDRSMYHFLEILR